MICWKCAGNSRVIQTWRTKVNFMRRRLCLECKARFTTEEPRKCSFCEGGMQSKTRYSHLGKGNVRRRLRQCACEARFPTWETVVTDRGDGALRELKYWSENDRNVAKMLRKQLYPLEKYHNTLFENISVWLRINEGRALKRGELPFPELPSLEVYLMKEEGNDEG